MSNVEYRTFTARSYSCGKPGRAICNSRNHHFIADEFGGDEISAGEYFLSGLTACAVNMLERVAKEIDAPLISIDVQADGTYRRNQGTESRTLFDTVEIRFQFFGISDDEAELLVATYHKRCPLYGTVAAATPKTKTTIVVKPS